MEKRTIIAFILSFLILVLWSVMYRPKQQPPQKQEPPQKVESPRQAVVPGPTESQGREAPKPAPLAPQEPVKQGAEIPQTPEKEITIDTPLYRAVFSNVGAVLKRFELKKYRQTTAPDSPLVELIDSGEKGTNPAQAGHFQIGFAPQSAAGIQDLRYQVNTEAVTLGPDSAPRDLIFRAKTPEGITVVQTYRIDPTQYPIDLVVRIENGTQNQATGNIRAAFRTVAPQIKSSYYAFVGVALLLNDTLEKIKQSKMEEKKSLSGKIDWMAYESEYFIRAVVPVNGSNGAFVGQSLPDGGLDASYIGPQIALAPQGTSTSDFRLYFGPRDVGILKKVGQNLDRAVNFGWFDIIAKPLLYVLRFFNQYVKNYGVSIILLTIIIKIIFWPLTHKSYKSMKEMQKLQPLMAKIREKYKNNKEQMNKELMALYKTYKVNPFGGCLPMVIQIPVFFALYRILGNSIELRHAPFMLWITDLSAPDRLFHFPFKIPYMSPPYGIPVLTLFMGASMFIQQKMTPTPGDPSQAKIMLALPIVFTVMFINFPSGLVLYWLVNNLLSIGQQYRIKKSVS